MKEKDWITHYWSHALGMQAFRKNKEEKRLKKYTSNIEL